MMNESHELINGPPREQVIPENDVANANSYYRGDLYPQQLVKEEHEYVDLTPKGAKRRAEETENEKKKKKKRKITIEEETLREVIDQPQQKQTTCHQVPLDEFDQQQAKIRDYDVSHYSSEFEPHVEILESEEFKNRGFLAEYFPEMINGLPQEQVIPDNDVSVADYIAEETENEKKKKEIKIEEALQEEDKLSPVPFELSEFDDMFGDLSNFMDESDDEFRDRTFLEEFFREEDTD